MKYPIIAVAAVAIVASGCQRKAEGQTVAVVNGDEITVPDLNFALDQAKVPESADKKAARNQVLQQLVDRQLLVQQARKEGIDKTPEYLNREREGEQQLLLAMLADRRLKTAQLPSETEINNYIATHPGLFANRELWTMNQILYSTPTDAGIKAEITAAKTLDQLIGVLKKHNIAYQQQTNRLDTAAIPADLFTKLSGLPAGEPFTIPIGDRTIASAITGREPHPIIGDQAKPVAVAAMRKAQTAKSLEGLLKSLRSSAKIEYQPGYSAPPAKD